MSHELEMVAGKASMAYAGETPWHGLGKRVPADLTTNQMLEAAGLDWEVKKVALSYKWNGSTRGFPEEKALIRMSDGKPLTITGDDWNPVQNQQMFDFFHEFVMKGNMEMHTAGSIHGGKVVWALAKIKDAFDVFGGDVVESFLLFANFHQYGKKTLLRSTAIRVVCNNTFTWALEGESGREAKVSHRVVFDAEDVKEVLGISKHQLDHYKEQALFLGSKRYTTETLREYLNDVYEAASAKKTAEGKLSRSAEQILAVVETQPGAQFAPGSWWQAFNAVTYGVDHFLGKTVDTRLHSAWFGGNGKRKEKALSKAIEYANAT